MVSEIHIPDSVVKEFTGHLSVKDPQTGVLTSEKIDHDIAMCVGHYAIRESFLKDALEGKDDYVKIIHSPESAHFFEKIKGEYKKIHGLADDTGWALPGAQKKFSVQREKIKQIKSTTATDMGELQCDRHAIHYAMRFNAPVVVLMEDARGHKVLKKNLADSGHDKELNVYRLNTTGLLKAMDRSGLLASVGITASGHEMAQHLFYERYKERKVINPYQINNKREEFGAFTKRLSIIMTFGGNRGGF